MKQVYVGITTFLVTSLLSLNAFALASTDISGDGINFYPQVDTSKAGQSATAWFEEAQLEAGLTAIRVKLKEQGASTLNLQSFPYQGELIYEDYLSVSKSSAGVAVAWLGSPNGFNPVPNFDDDPNANVSWEVYVYSKTKFGVRQPYSLGRSARSPAVSMDEQGNTTVLWIEENNDSNWDIRSATLDPSGTLESIETLGTAPFVVDILLDTDDSGRDFVIWRGLLSSSDSLYFTSRAPDRLEWEAPRKVAQDVRPSGVSMDVSPSGEMAIAWRERKGDPSNQEEYLKTAWLDKSSGLLRDPIVLASHDDWVTISNQQVAVGNNGAVAISFQGTEPVCDCTKGLILFKKPGVQSFAQQNVSLESSNETISNFSLALDMYKKPLLTWSVYNSSDNSEKVYLKRDKVELIGEGLDPQISSGGCQASIVWSKTIAYNTSGWFRRIEQKDLRLCPSLQMAIKGPQTVALGKRAVYRVLLSNKGQEAARDVKVSLRTNRFQKTLSRKAVDRNVALQFSVPTYARGRQTVTVSLTSSNAPKRIVKKVLRVR